MLHSHNTYIYIIRLEHCMREPIDRITKQKQQNQNQQKNTTTQFNKTKKKMKKEMNIFA